jgi:hypothetical protein
MIDIELYFYLLFIAIALLTIKYKQQILIKKHEPLIIISIVFLCYLFYIKLTSKKTVENFFVSSDIPLVGIPKDIPNNDKIQEITSSTYDKFNNTSFNTNVNISIDLTDINEIFNTYFYFSNSYNGQFTINNLNITMPILSNKWYYVSYNPLLLKYKNNQITTEIIDVDFKNANQYNNMYIKTNNDIHINTSQIKKYIKFYVYYVGDNIGHFLEKVTKLEKNKYNLINSESKMFYDSYECDLVKNNWYSITYNPTYPYLYIKQEKIFNYNPPDIQNNLILYYKFNEDYKSHKLAESSDSNITSNNIQINKLYNSIQLKYDANISSQNVITTSNDGIIYNNFLTLNHDNYVILPSVILNLNNFTISFWLRLKSVDEYNHFVINDHKGTLIDGIIFEFNNTTTNNNICLFISNGILKGKNDNYVFKIANINTDIWYHIVWTNKLDTEQHINKWNFYITPSNNTNDYNPNLFEIDHTNDNNEIEFDKNNIGMNSDLIADISDFRLYNKSSNNEFCNLLWNISKYQKNIDNAFIL